MKWKGLCRKDAGRKRVVKKFPIIPTRYGCTYYWLEFVYILQVAQVLVPWSENAEWVSKEVVDKNYTVKQS